MCNGGLFWFEDLSVADPYYILPTVMCSTTFLQIKLGADGMNAGAMGPVAKQVIYLIPPVMFLFMKDFPAVSATNVLGSSSIFQFIYIYIYIYIHANKEINATKLYRLKDSRPRPFFIILQV